MIEFVKLNGTAVRATDLRRRTVAQPDGATCAEIDLIVILRGQAAHETFLALLESRPLRLEIPPDGPTLETAVTDSRWIASGDAYRHELTLREVAPTDEAPPLAPVKGEADQVAVRLEALIEALDRAGVVHRSVVDEIHRRLLQDRTA